MLSQTENTYNGVFKEAGNLNINLGWAEKRKKKIGNYLQVLPMSVGGVIGFSVK